MKMFLLSLTVLMTNSLLAYDAGPVKKPANQPKIKVVEQDEDLADRRDWLDSKVAEVKRFEDTAMEIPAAAEVPVPSAN